MELDLAHELQLAAIGELWLPHLDGDWLHSELLGDLGPDDVEVGPGVQKCVYFDAVTSVRLEFNLNSFKLGWLECDGAGVDMVHGRGFEGSHDRVVLGEHVVVVVDLGGVAARLRFAHLGPVSDPGALVARSSLGWAGYALTMFVEAACWAGLPGP